MALLIVFALAAGPRCTDLVAISDLHGHVGALPEIAGRVMALRGRGPVVVVDAGDSMEGTFESDQSQGRAVIEALGALGLDAAVAGNHDFDYGPEVLRRRAAEASFWFVLSNVDLVATGRSIDWQHMAERRILRPVGGPVIGVFGLMGEETPFICLPRNVAPFKFRSAAAAAVAEATALRSEGAEMVVALAHIGGRCAGSGGDPSDLSGCDMKSDLFELVQALPPGTLDAVVGGHTHEILARRVNGVAVVQAGANGQALAWLTICQGGRVEIHAPVRIGKGAPGERDVGAEKRMAAVVEPFIAAARAEAQKLVGVKLDRPLTREGEPVSALGAAVAASLRRSGKADFGLINPHGIRVDLPAGELRYGALYEALPFEDRVVVVTLKGSEVASLVNRLMKRGRAPQVAGMLLTPDGARTCSGGELEPERQYQLATDEFYAGHLGRKRRMALPRGLGPPEAHTELVREAFVEWLRRTTSEQRGVPCP